MNVQDLHKEIKRRMNINEIYDHNYYEHLKKKEYIKASEDLWGMVNNLASILSLLFRGKPISDHNDMRRFIDSISTLKSEPKLKELLLACERLHANFYHNFMDEIQLEEHIMKAEEFTQLLKKYIWEKLQELRLSSTQKKEY